MAATSVAAAPPGTGAVDKLAYYEQYKKHVWDRYLVIQRVAAFILS